MQEYGKVFGVYEGRQPQVFVCDPELVRLICVKDADYFNDKRRIEYGDPIMNEMPDFQEYEKWKLLRSLASPVFTSAKIKLMNLPMREATQDFATSVKQKIKQSGGVLEKFAIDRSIHSMLTDLIARCVFSIRVTSQDDDDNELAKIVKELMTPPNTDQSPTLLAWSHSIPFLKKFMPGLFKPEPVQRFSRIFRQMLEERKRSGVKRHDVVDLCLEWYDRLDSPEFQKAKITELSIFCQALVFFFATQDQVTTMVSMVIYHMTLNPDIEKRVYKEVDAMFAKHGEKLDHEHWPEFTYVNACINEALRMYAFFHRLERVCTKEWYNDKYNLRIPEGMTIQMPIWAINRCSEYTEDGDKFAPERFLPENKDKFNPYASTSFGHGPRNCTGQRFANEVMTLIVVYILKELKFKARKDTEVKYINGGAFFQPYEPIYLNVMERKEKAI